MGNNNSTAGGAGPGGKKAPRTGQYQSAAAASLSSFQNQATLHRIRQQQQASRQSSASSTPASNNTATASPVESTRVSPTTSPLGTASQNSRRRKSIELPDHDPKLAFSSVTVPGSSAATPLGGPMPGVGRKAFGDLRDFKLTLPEKRSKLASSDMGMPGDAAEAETEVEAEEGVIRGGVEAMRIDAGEDTPGGDPATLKADLEIEGTSVASPSIIAPDPESLGVGALPAAPMPHHLISSPAVLAPFQQPTETVVPPLPPAINKPFPPPLPVAPVAPSTTANVVHSVEAATEAVHNATPLDVGAGPDGVPTLITWKEPAQEVYVTGTFSRWKQQIKLRKNPSEAADQTDFSALVSLPPGPHRLKFIVDKKWKTSKYLPSATDAAGNLINYLQVNPGDQPFRGLGPRGMWSGYTYGNWSLGTIANAAVLDVHDSEWHDNDDDWTKDIPQALLDYEDVFDGVDEDDEPIPPPEFTPGPGERGFSTEPPKLPAQLTQGILNMGSKGLESVTDDNSLLPKPDHSVLNHLAASPIKGGLLSVGVTLRYKRKYVTVVFYKPATP